MPVGAQVGFEVVLEAQKACPVLVDYILQFHCGEGGTARRKVMKLGQGEVRPDQPLRLVKRYRVPRDATTVKIVPGPHRIEVQVNGSVLGGLISR